MNNNYDNDNITKATIQRRLKRKVTSTSNRNGSGGGGSGSGNDDQIKKDHGSLVNTNSSNGSDGSFVKVQGLSSWFTIIKSPTTMTEASNSHMETEIDTKTNNTAKIKTDIETGKKKTETSVLELKLRSDLAGILDLRNRQSSHSKQSLISIPYSVQMNPMELVQIESVDSINLEKKKKKEKNSNKRSERWCELPPRSRILGIIVDDAEENDDESTRTETKAILEMVENVFQRSNFKVEWMVWGCHCYNNRIDEHHSSNNDRCSSHEEEDDNAIVRQIKYMAQHQQSLSRYNKYDHIFPPRWCLWGPNPLLNKYVNYIETDLLASSSNNKKILTAIDLGCGSGRDVVFLSLRRRHHRQQQEVQPYDDGGISENGNENNLWHAKGIDHLEGCVQRAKSFAERHGLLLHHRLSTENDEINNDHDEHDIHPGCEFQCANISNLNPHRLQQQRQYDLVIISRTNIVSSESFNIINPLVKPGGFILYHHFMKGYCSHPKTGLIEKDELEKRFSSCCVVDREKKGDEDNEVEESEYESPIVDDVYFDPSDGRGLTFFLVRKKVQNCKT